MKFCSLLISRANRARDEPKKMAALQVRVLLTLTLTLALTTEMAAFQVATTTLENKAGQKVAASEALKGKVVALYVCLALSRTAPPATR